MPGSKYTPEIVTCCVSVIPSVKYFLISIVMSSSSMLDVVGIHTFGGFLDLLLLISNLIPLELESTLSDFNSFTFGLFALQLRMWSVW